MQSNTLVLGPVETVSKTFRRGLGLIVPLAVTAQVSSWLAALVEGWFPTLSMSPFARLVIGLGSAFSLAVAAGWIWAGVNRAGPAAVHRVRPRRPPAFESRSRPLPFPTSLAGSLS